MPGKPITLTESEYSILSQAKQAYEKSKGATVHWGRFVMFLLGLYIQNEVGKKNQDTNNPID